MLTFHKKLLHQPVTQYLRFQSIYSENTRQKLVVKNNYIQSPNMQSINSQNQNRKQTRNWVPGKRTRQSGVIAGNADKAAKRPEMNWLEWLALSEAVFMRIFCLERVQKTKFLCAKSEVFRIKKLGIKEDPVNFWTNWKICKN
jgi:hypothetical protein